MTSPVDTTVKIYHSDMVGAPVLTGAAGTLIALLDACLVNGFGIKTLTSMTVTAGVATAAFSGTHPAMVDSVVLIAGNANANLNGEQKVTGVGTGTVSFATAEANGTYTGTTTMKLAAGGWEKRFTGTNLAVYRSLDVGGNRLNYRINDLASSARVIGYETMTAVSTGTKLFPTTAQISGGTFWLKNPTGDITSPIPWVLFTNGKTVYLGIASQFVQNGSTNYLGKGFYGFGEFTSWKATAEAYNSFVNGGSSSGSGDGFLELTWASTVHVARPITGAVGCQAQYASSSASISGPSGSVGAGGELPGITGRLITSRSLVINIGSPDYAARGRMPGLVHILQGILQAVGFSNFDTIDGVGDLAGRKLSANVCYTGSPPYDSVYRPSVFFDVTGPWN